MQDLPPPAPILVLQPNPVIAADMTEAILICVPQATVWTVAAPQVALERLAAGVQLAAAFLALSEEQIDASGLAMAVAACGARLVIVHDAITPERAAERGWLWLPEPFSADMLDGAVRAVLGRC